MGITREVVEQTHRVDIKTLDSTSRFNFKLECSCGIQGHFFNLQDAEAYKEEHLRRKQFFPG